MQMLKRIRVAGWKSIKDQTIDLSPLTVVLGSNGAGKSNLLSLFKLLNVLFGIAPDLRAYVAKSGGADSLLHFGMKRTPVAELEISLDTHTGETRYFARWGGAARGALVFLEERVEFLRRGSDAPQVLQLGAGHAETNLATAAQEGDPTARTALRLFRSCRLFHLHDTSDESAVRQPCNVEDNRHLFPDAGNLAAMLYLFREKHPAAFHRIEGAVRQMVPNFGAFVLEPRALNEKQILLNWVQKGRDYEFGPHQLSDGSLRFMALATLLLQPPEKLPLVIALDEPELGLHPMALEVLAGMAQGAASHCQVVFATQSASFLDHFEPEDVVVVDAPAGESRFTRLSAERLDAWREAYTLGEIWKKNVVGGGPYG